MASIIDSNIVEGLTDTKSFRTQSLTQDTMASTLSLTNSSEELFIFTGSVAGQIVKLPDATTLQMGHRYEIHNNSNKDVSVTDYLGISLNTMTSGQRLFIALQDSSTSGGIWSLVEAEKISGQTSGANTSVFNDFLLDVFHTHSMIIDNTLNGGVSNMDTTVTDNSYSGSFTLSTGTTLPSLTTMGKSIAMNNVGLTMMAGGQSIEWRLRIPILSGNTTVSPRFDVKTGLQDTDLIGDPPNGIYFQYSDNINSGKWVGVSRNNSISTVVNSNVTVVANVWYRVRFVVNTLGTSVDFYIDDNFIGNSIFNIPSTNGCRLQASIEKKSYNIQNFLPATVNTTTDIINLSGHGFANLDRVVFTTTTTLPSPLSAATIYYIRNITPTTFQLSTSATGSLVNFSAQGSGTHTIYEVSAISSSAQWDWYMYSVTRI